MTLFGIAVQSRHVVLCRLQIQCSAAQRSAQPHCSCPVPSVQLCLTRVRTPSSVHHSKSLELPQAAVVFQEGVTTLLGGAKLPASGLCGRSFKVQFSARNGAGYSTTVTTSATYIMPACPGETKTV